MKMGHLRGLAVACALMIGSLAGVGHAQSLYGSNPFQNDAGSPPASQGLFYLDLATGAIVDGRTVTVPGRTITGVQGVTYDASTGNIYAIARATGVAGRLLIDLDVSTGTGVEIGNLGDNFSSITIGAGGQMFGVTGDGATTPETLWSINKTTAAVTLLTALGNGADGEVIAYNPDDGLLYHWSGGSPVYESILPTAPYTVTNIPLSGEANTGEVFGAVWDADQGVFLVHSISSRMQSWSTTGVISATQAATLGDVRGLALIPAAGPPAVVPTLTEWAMILMAMLLAGGGMLILRRRSA